MIQNIDLDSLNYQIFTKIEKIMQNEVFSFNKINNYYSPCLIHLINFEMGVMEYFRAIRKYCLNFYDYNILDKDEIYFCQKMDSILKIYYKIKNYTYNKCQKFHQKSIELLKTIDLEQNYVGEIKDELGNDINIKEHFKDYENNIQNLPIDNENNKSNMSINDIDNGKNINIENDNIEEFNNINNDKNGQ